MFVYLKSEPQLWTVGFYAPNGEWVSESDYECRDDAAERVHWLNGGGNQYTACSTAQGCIYCGHQKLEKMDKLEPEEGWKKRLVDGEWKHYCPECGEVKEP